MKFLRFLKNLWVDAVWQRISREYITEEGIAYFIIAVIASTITGVIYLLGKASIALGIPTALRMSKLTTESPLIAGMVMVALITTVIGTAIVIKQFYSYCHKIWQRS